MMDEEMHLNQPSVRRSLLPFDEVTLKTDGVKTTRRDIKNFLNDLQKERQKFVMQKQQKLKVLSKVGDNCYVFIEPEKSFIHKKLIQLDSMFPVFRPESVFMFIWNFFVLFAILFNFFQIPVALFLTEKVYDTQTNTAGGLAVNIIFLLILIIDTFFIRFNLTFYKNGKEITSRVNIFQKYIKFRFWIDFISTVVLFIFIVGGNPNLVYLKIVFYIKIYTLVIIDQEILDWLDIHPISFAIYRFFRVILLLWFFTTWFASVYFAIDYYFYKQRGYYWRTGQLWLTYSGIVDNLNMIQNFQWYVWYLYAVYWYLQSSTTVGYGNVTPKNPLEVLYCNIAIMFGTLFFAFYINEIWNIIGDLQQSSSRYAENWGKLNVMMKDAEITPNLKDKVSDYLREVWLDEDREYLEEQIGQLLSQDLKDQLFLSSRGQLYNNIPLFNEIASHCSESRDFYRKLVYSYESEFVGIDEIIYQSQSPQINLYYIRKGKVELCIDRPKLGIEVFVEDNFGFEEFLSEQIRFCTAKALTFCQVWRLSLSTFKQIMKQYPSIHEKYSQLKENVLFYHDVGLGKIKCLKCNNYSHFTRDCQQINKWRKRLANPQQKLLRSYLQNDGPMFRTKHVRKDKSSKKTLGVYLWDKGVDADTVSQLTVYRISRNLK